MKDDVICLQGLSPSDKGLCTVRSCKNCGWNAEVEEKRKEIIRNDGLTECADGLRRLIIPNTDDLIENIP